MEIVSNISHSPAKSQPKLFFGLDKKDKIWYVLEIWKCTTQIKKSDKVFGLDILHLCGIYHSLHTYFFPEFLETQEYIFWFF